MKKTLDIVGLLLYNRRGGAKLAEVSRQKYFLTQKVDYPYGQRKTHTNLRNGGKSSSYYYWRGGAKIFGKSKILAEARSGVFHVEHCRPGKLARFLSRGPDLGRDPRPVNVGIICRVAIDDAPRLGVDDTVGDAALLLEAFGENGDLDSSIRQRRMILNK